MAILKIVSILVLSLLAGARAQEEIMTLKQIHVVTRHGSRLPLIKHAETLKEGITTLTPLGQRQLFDLGMWVNERYKDKGIFDVYDPSQVRLESSSFDRTIVSANSFALGLFNAVARDPLNETFIPASSITLANIPVYTKDVKNDVTIRAYDKCASGLQLEKLYQSQDWINMENSNLDLLNQLGTFPQFADHTDSQGKVPLKDLWNVFDAIYVSETECMAQPLQSSCSLERKELMNILSDNQWKEVQQLSHEAEFLKYGRDSVAKYIGSNLLSQIWSRMSDSASTNLIEGFDSFYLYSAHYPTLIGMRTLLGDNEVDREVIPEYSSALIFEFYQNDTSSDKEIKVRVIYRPGDGDTHRIINVDESCTSDGLCPLNNIQNQVKLLSQGEWCDECSNDTADVCLLEKYNEQKSRISRITHTTISATSFFAGFLVAVIILGVSYQYYQRTRYYSSTSAPQHESSIQDPSICSYA
jgi:Histidine acid phosphatase.